MPLSLQPERKRGAFSIDQGHRRKYRSILVLPFLFEILKSRAYMCSLLADSSDHQVWMWNGEFSIGGMFNKSRTSVRLSPGRAVI